MAISIVNGNRGTATEKVSDTSLTLTPSANLGSGNYALLVVVIDNVGTGEGATTDVSVTDNGPGATWTRLEERTEANTAAGTGVTIALFLAKLNSALTTSHTITITCSAASTAKGAGLAELSCGAGAQIVKSASGGTGSNGAASTSYSVALSSLTNVAGLYIGVAGAEEELDTAVTLDAAYTEIGFGSIGSGTAGANATNVRARVGTLANTSTGDTFNASSLTSADRATIIVRLEELLTQTLTPSGFAHTRAFGTASVIQNILTAAVVHTRAFGTTMLPRKGEVAWAQFQVPQAPPGAQVITPSGFAHTRAFGTPTVGRGAVIVAPSSVVQSRVINGPLIIIRILTSAVVHTRAFGTAKIVSGVFPPSVVHSRAIGTATVASASQVIQTTSVQHGRAFGAVVVNARSGRVSWAMFVVPTVVQFVSPASVVHTRAFGAGGRIWQSKIYQQSVIHTRAIGSHAVVGNQAIQTTSVIHQRAFGTAFTGNEPDIAAAGFMFLFGDFEFGVIEPPSVVHARAFGLPHLTLTLKTSSVIHTRAFGAVVIGRFILPQSALHDRAFGLPLIGRVIFPASTIHDRLVETPDVVGGARTIIGQGFARARFFGSPTITVSAFLQNLSPPSVIHSRNITGPLVTRAGDPPVKRQGVFSPEWGVDSFHEGDVKVDQRA